LPRLPDLGPPLSAEVQPPFGTYREFRHRFDADPAYSETISADTLPPAADVYNTVPNRWGLEQPDYRRYSPKGEYIYTKPRCDDHVALQEAFAEVKLHDLGPNYDFVSARAGIQQFNADFRGFLFVDEEPALRIFGNLHSDRMEYNVAYIQFLEKNTNSGLNTFDR